MAYDQLQQPQSPAQPPGSGKRKVAGGLAKGVATKTAAGLLVKLAIVLVVLVVGAGAFVKWHHHQVATVANGVVLKKLQALGVYHAAEATYTFNFNDVVHKSFLFFTGETIHVVGSGTDDAIVNFNNVHMVRDSPTSVTVLVPQPTLGTPAVNLNQTTLSEKSGFFSHLDNLLSSHPNDARLVLSLAQTKIGAAAASTSQLTDLGRAQTRTFLTKLLEPLGITHVTVDFL
jgi:hypothetical protein